MNALLLRLAAALALVPVLCVVACDRSRAPPRSASPESPMATKPEKVTKTEAEWRAQLTPEQYHVTREKGTERAFTGKYWDAHEDGTYRCVCCGAVLFRSDDKFDSHCGWPSFDKGAPGSGITETRDSSFGMDRTEVTCTKCGAHLGHVFDDGPTSTGLRYCINSASIDLEKKGEPEKKTASGTPSPSTPAKDAPAK